MPFVGHLSDCGMYLPWKLCPPPVKCKYGYVRTFFWEQFMTHSLCICLVVITQVVNPFGEGLKQSKQKQSERRLPERRTAIATSARDSVAIPRGFMTSDQVIELLSHRKEDPSRWTPQLAAEKYGLNAAEAKQLLKHFGNLQIVAKLKIDAKLESNPD